MVGDSKKYRVCYNSFVFMDSVISNWRSWMHQLELGMLLFNKTQKFLLYRIFGFWLTFLTLLQETQFCLRSVSRWTDFKVRTLKISFDRHAKFWRNYQLWVIELDWLFNQVNWLLNIAIYNTYNNDLEKIDEKIRKDEK